MRNLLYTQASFKPCSLGEGHLSGAAAYRVRHVPQTQKTSEESRNDQMKSAGRTSNMRETSNTGRLRTTEDKERQFSGCRKANAQQTSSLGWRPVSVPDGRHGFTFLPHATALASDALRVRRRREQQREQQQVPQQLLLCSGTQRPRARPHTPHARAAPPSRPLTLIGRACRGRALRPGPRREMSPRRSGGLPRAARVSGARSGRSDWQAG